MIKRFGIMQIDKRHHECKAYLIRKGVAHIEQAAAFCAQTWNALPRYIKIGSCLIS